MRRNAIVLFLATVLVLVIFLPPFGEWQKKKRRNEAYDAKIQSLAQEKAQLEEEQRRLEHDPAYLEKVAREKMGLIKEGETVYKIRPVEAVQ